MRSRSRPRRDVTSADALNHRGPRHEHRAFQRSTSPTRARSRAPAMSSSPAARAARQRSGVFAVKVAAALRCATDLLPGRLAADPGRSDDGAMGTFGGTSIELINSYGQRQPDDLSDRPMQRSPVDRRRARRAGASLLADDRRQQQERRHARHARRRRLRDPRPRRCARRIRHRPAISAGAATSRSPDVAAASHFDVGITNSAPLACSPASAA